MGLTEDGHARLEDSGTGPIQIDRKSVSAWRAPAQTSGNAQDPRFPQPYQGLRFITQRELVASATPSATFPSYSYILRLIFSEGFLDPPTYPPAKFLL